MDRVEELTQSIGRKLLRLVKAQTLPVIRARWWEETLMMMFLKDPGLRTQVLRFVDVFPVLEGREEKLRYFREYFIEGLENPPGIFRFAGKIQGRGLWERSFVFCLDKAMEAVASRFIVSSKYESLLRVVQRLRKKGFGYTVDLLGEEVISESEADRYKERYLDAVDVLVLAGVPIDFSLKLSSLYSQFNPLNSEESCRAVKPRLREILRKVKRSGGTLTIDMESYHYHGLILRIFIDVFSEEEFLDFKTPGIAIQYYLRDSKETMQKLTDWARERPFPVKVRLIKGAYWDTEMILAGQNGWEPPVFTEKWQTDRAFEDAIPQLLENPNIILAAGTHNVRSAARLLAEARIRNIPGSRVEHQVLWGMGNSIAAAVSKLGFPVRFYVSCGETLPGMSYLVRRIIENSSQAGFLFQNSTGTSAEILLQDPRNFEPKEA